MPHNSNGEIYVDGTGSVTYGVSINDVQSVLKDYSNDLGTLCTSDKINMWARYKPVRYEGFPIRKFDNSTVFDRTTGLTIGSMTGKPTDVVAFEGTKIEYQRPNGGINSPYRLTDFQGYYHNAEKPVEIKWREEFKMDKGMNCTVIISNRTSSAQDKGSISFSDILNEVSDYGNFKNSDKRLCLGVIEKTSTSDQEPFWYCFSEEKFTAAQLSSGGTISVSTNMYYAPFTSLLTIGKTYKFVVMLVSNYATGMEAIVGGDHHVYDYGVPASTMVSWSNAGYVSAMSLEFEDEIHVKEATLQEASVVTDMTYTLDALEAYKFGDNVTRSQYNILCTEIYLPTITVQSPTELTSARYQLRFSFSQSNTQFSIFTPTGTGDNKYAISSTPSTALTGFKLTPWVTVSDIGGGTSRVVDGVTVWEYEFDFPNRQYVILSNDSELQTAGLSSGIYFFFDEDASSGSTFDMKFELYYIPADGYAETKVRTVTLSYNTNYTSSAIYDYVIPE